MNKMNEILITIVVPVYNVRKYLNKCIDSILNQTFKNIEVILVNDGSTDGSDKICDEYAKKDGRVKVIHKENGGVSSARNLGIDAAQGEYIGFIDSDDWIDPTMYESLLRLLIKEHADIAQCTYVNAPTEDIKIKEEAEEIKTISNIEGLKNFYNNMYVDMVIPCNKLYDISLFKGIRYNSGRIYEDEGTTYKLIYRASKIAVTNKVFYYYRNTENSITEATFSKKNLDILYVYDEKLKFIKDINDDELYAKTMKWYFYSIINVYYKCQKHFQDDKQIINLVNEKIEEGYKEYISLPKKEFKWVILLTLFKMYPNIYKKLVYARG